MTAFVVLLAVSALAYGAWRIGVAVAPDEFDARSARQSAHDKAYSAARSTSEQASYLEAWEVWYERGAADGRREGAAAGTKVGAAAARRDAAK